MRPRKLPIGEESRGQPHQPRRLSSRADARDGRIHIAGNPRDLSGRQPRALGSDGEKNEAAHVLAIWRPARGTHAYIRAVVVVVVEEWIPFGVPVLLVLGGRGVRRPQPAVSVRVIRRSRRPPVPQLRSARRYHPPPPQPHPIGWAGPCGGRPQYVVALVGPRTAGPDARVDVGFGLFGRTNSRRRRPRGQSKQAHLPRFLRPPERQ